MHNPQVKDYVKQMAFPWHYVKDLEVFIKSLSLKKWYIATPAKLRVPPGVTSYHHSSQCATVLLV